MYKMEHYKAELKFASIMLGGQCVTISLAKRMLKLYVPVLEASTALVGDNFVLLSINFTLKLLSGAVQITTTSFGSGPIFLEALECTTSDTDLLNCHTTFTSVGLTDCNHNQDVSVKCRGIILF